MESEGGKCRMQAELCRRLQQQMEGCRWHGVAAQDVVKACTLSCLACNISREHR